MFEREIPSGDAGPSMMRVIAGRRRGRGSRADALQSQDGAKAITVGTPIAIIGEEGDDLSGADALAAEGSGSGSGSSAPKPSASAPKPSANSTVSAVATNNNAASSAALPTGTSAEADPTCEIVYVTVTPSA